MAPGQENVLRLDVSMDHSVAVREIQRVGNFTGDLDGVGHRQLPFTSQPIPKAFTLDKRHREPQLVIRLPRVEDADDVRVLKAGGEADFLLETIGAERRRDLGMEDFQRDRSIVSEVVREKHGGKAAASQFAVDPILPRELIGERAEVSQFLYLQRRHYGARRASKQDVSFYGPRDPGTQIIAAG